jgi:hypothetical protein
MVLDTGDRLPILTDIVSIPAVPWDHQNPVRTFDFTVRPLPLGQSRFGVVLGGGDYRVDTYGDVEVFSISVTSLSSTVVRITVLAQGTSAAQIAIGVV